MEIGNIVGFLKLNTNAIWESWLICIQTAFKAYESF